MFKSAVLVSEQVNVREWPWVPWTGAETRVSLRSAQLSTSLGCNPAPSTGGISTWMREHGSPRHVAELSLCVFTKQSAEYNEIWHIINTPYAEAAHKATAERFFEEEKKILSQLLFGV